MGWILIVGLFSYSLFNITKQTYEGAYNDGYIRAKDELKEYAECKDLYTKADSVITERDSTISIQKRIIRKMVSGEY